MKYILLLLLNGCATSNEWKMHSAHPGGTGMYRYENTEVVCYSLTKSDDVALQCKFKPENRVIQIKK